MAKDPAFLFYPGDFLTGTQFMTDEQVGKYIRLLLAQHQHGHLSDNQVLHICKTYDNEVMSKFLKDSSGLWFNERLEKEVVKRKNFCKSRSENRVGKNDISKSSVIDMENKNNVLDINKESKVIILGTGKNYFIVDRKYLHDNIFRIQGIDGFKQYMEESQSVLNYPHFAEKFMRKYNGAKFNDFMHVFNTYNKFTDNA